MHEHMSESPLCTTCLFYTSLKQNQLNRSRNCTCFTCCNYVLWIFFTLKHSMNNSSTAFCPLLAKNDTERAKFS